MRTPMRVQLARETMKSIAYTKLVFGAALMVMVGRNVLRSVSMPTSHLSSSEMEKHSNLDITSRKLKTDGSTATKRVLVEQGSAVVVQLKEPAPRKMEEPAAATEGPSNTRKIKTQQLRATRNGPGSILALHKKQQEGVVNSDRNQEVSIRVDDDDDEEEELLQQHLPKNMHKDYGFECAEKFDMSKVHPATFSLFDMVFGYTKGQRNTIGHRQYSGSMNAGVQLLSKIQSCNYAALQRFQQLAEEYNITRWSAHGGTLMAAVCHRSMNPWDDDIDFTVSDCATLEKIHANGGNVTAKYPEIPLQRHTAQGWVGKLIDDDWILIKAQPGRKNSWFKLKAVAQARQFKGADLMGTDIMCLDKYISDSERGVMKRSGFRDYLKSDKPLQEIEFGPTQMKLVPNEIVNDYVLDRYGKAEFCDFPLDKSLPPSISKKKKTLQIPHRASQLEEALTKWYYPKNMRSNWLNQIGVTKGNDLNQKIPNLNQIEIDNTIAQKAACQLATPGRPLKVIGWNAERGTYWDEFADMVTSLPDLEKPDLVVLNEMDIGMARSGNVHTARKLAFRLGMNYAWGLEFIELTNGNREEQNATMDMLNEMGLHGNAILSTCPIFDPLIVRDQLDERYFSNTKFKGNDMGSEKRLGGRMGLFARTGPSLNDKTSPHVIAGSVHKVKPTTHRERLWEYFGFGSFPNTTEKGLPGRGSAPNHVLAIVAQGDLESRAFCTHSGLNNLDKPQKHKTFPADCATKRLGNWRGDHFCGNTKVHREDSSILPCYIRRDEEGQVNSTAALQISDHAIVEIVVETML